MTEHRKATRYEQLYCQCPPGEDLVLEFTAKIVLPKEGFFHCRSWLIEHPKTFIEEWLSGAIGTIYSGPPSFKGRTPLPSVSVNVHRPVKPFQAKPLGWQHEKDLPY